MVTELEKRNAAAHFNWLIDWYRGQQVLPAMGGGIVIGGDVVLATARGVRKHGTNTAVQPSDRFQLGSITKPMTGMLMARLVDQGVLTWNQTISQTWPDLFNGSSGTWKAHYASRNIVDLMTHTSGMRYAPTAEASLQGDAIYAAIHPMPIEGQIAKRRMYTQLAVLDKPLDKDEYSGGCIVCAGMAQQKTGQTWETLIQTQVFQPLGITSVAIGPMSQLDSVTDIWQHRVESGGVVSHAIPPSHMKQTEWTHGPAGAVGLSMPDFGKWIAALLNQPSSFMSQTTWQQYLGLPAAGYSVTRGGWFGDGNYLNHNGSNTWNYAIASIDRARKIGAFAACNIGTEEAEKAVNDLHIELEAAAAAWPAMGWMHQAVTPAQVSCSSDSTWDNTGTYAATLMSDTWWRTRWASASATPTINVLLDQPRMLKGVVLCEAYGPVCKPSSST